MANNDWMAGADDDAKLNMLFLPGSHDACMYECRTTTSSSAFIIQSSVTQFLSVREQLDAGTRFFDMRLYRDRDSGVIRPGHFPSKDSSTSGMGEYGPPFADICADIRGFLTANPSEVVIIKFAMSKKASPTAPGAIAQGLGNFLYSTGVKQNLADVPLHQLRGKVLALFDKPIGEMPGQQKTFHLVSKKTPLARDKATVLGNAKRSILWLNGDAPTADKITTVINKQNAVRTDENKQQALAPHLEMFYLTITAGTGTAIKAGLDALDVSGNRAKMCVADNTAREVGMVGVARVIANPLRSKYTGWAAGSGLAYRAKMLRVQGNRRVNIFIYDFINEEVNNVIIDKNPSRW